MAEAVFHAPEAMKQITLECRVTGSAELRWRIRIGLVFMKFAARIIGCGIEVKLAEK
jgi:hypothetical protein